MIKPEDCFNLEGLIGTTETSLGQIPVTKYERKIYGLLLNNHATATNGLKLRQYASDGTTLEKEWYFKLGALDTIDIARPLDLPFLSIPAGKYIKVVADSASIQLIIDCYDL
jgi:hypothetical protein